MSLEQDSDNKYKQLSQKDIQMQTTLKGMTGHLRSKVDMDGMREERCSASRR